MNYMIRRGGRSVVQTDWPPLAQAAWFREMRGDKWSAKEIADAMSEYGLATSRRRVDLLRGRDKEPPHASELVVLINAVMTAYAREAPE